MQPGTFARGEEAWAMRRRPWHHLRPPEQVLVVRLGQRPGQPIWPHHPRRHPGSKPGGAGWMRWGETDRESVCVREREREKGQGARACPHRTQDVKRMRLARPTKEYAGHRLAGGTNNRMTNPGTERWKDVAPCWLRCDGTPIPGGKRKVDGEGGWGGTMSSEQRRTQCANELVFWASQLDMSSRSRSVRLACHTVLGGLG